MLQRSRCDDVSRLCSELGSDVYSPTPSNAVHDPENSPMPVSPGLSCGSHHHRGIRSTPSADPNLFTVCVGMKPSSAQYYVNDVEGVLRSLYGLVLRDQEDRPAAAAATLAADGAAGGATSPAQGN